MVTLTCLSPVVVRKSLRGRHGNARTSCSVSQHLLKKCVSNVTNKSEVITSWGKTTEAAAHESASKTTGLSFGSCYSGLTPVSISPCTFLRFLSQPLRFISVVSHVLLLCKHWASGGNTTPVTLSLKLIMCISLIYRVHVAVNAKLMGRCKDGQLVRVIHRFRFIFIT